MFFFKIGLYDISETAVGLYIVT